MAIGEYEDALRFAGSLPDGTDVEYTTPPYRVHPPLGDVVKQQGQEIVHLNNRMDETLRRLAHVERLLHQRLNCPHCTDDYGNEVGAPAPLTAAERVELETLRAFKAGVPRSAIAEMFSDRWGEEDGNVPEFVTAVETWLDIMYPPDGAA